MPAGSRSCCAWAGIVLCTQSLHMPRRWGFLLKLLVRLFTDPSGFDRGGERLDGGIGRQVRHIVFLLSSRPPLANEPDLLARHAQHAIIEHPVLMAIRNTDTAGREETGQPTFGTPPPADLLPFLIGQYRLGGDWGPVGDVVLAAPSGFRDGEDQRDVGWVDVLAPRQAHRPQQTALAQSLSERPA